MNRLAFIMMSFILIFLAGCGSENFQVTLHTPKTFTPGKSFPMQIKMADSQGNPLADAQVSAVLEMKNMDHGTIPMTADEVGEGSYVGYVDLPMDGDWLAKIKVDHGGKIYEETKPFSIEIKTKETAHKVSKQVSLPDFTLTDENGETLTKQDLLGKTVVMTFTFVNCPDPNACPVLLGNFSKLQQDIKASGISTDDILLVSVSIDPENDTPEAMKEHALKMNFDMSYFKMLTGEMTKIQHVADALGVNFKKTDGEVLHDNKTLIFNQSGELTHEFTGSFIDRDELFQLVAGKK